MSRRPRYKYADGSEHVRKWTPDKHAAVRPEPDTEEGVPCDNQSCSALATEVDYDYSRAFPERRDLCIDCKTCVVMLRNGVTVEALPRPDRDILSFLFLHQDMGYQPDTVAAAVAVQATLVLGSVRRLTELRYLDGAAEVLTVTRVGAFLCRDLRSQLNKGRAA